MNEHTPIDADISSAMKSYADYHCLSPEIATQKCLDLLAKEFKSPIISNKNPNAAYFILKQCAFPTKKLSGIMKVNLYVDEPKYKTEDNSKEVSLYTIPESDGLLAAGLYNRNEENNIVLTSGAGYSIFEQLSLLGLNLNNRDNMNALQLILNQLFDSSLESPFVLAFDSTGNFIN